jgi:NAD(P)-dependent dehydrogenase (short-subunit alcohol dehydrogenase family)
LRRQLGSCLKLLVGSSRGIGLSIACATAAYGALAIISNCKADAALYLASNAASHPNGACLTVDGGFLLACERECALPSAHCFD